MSPTLEGPGGRAWDDLNRPGSKTRPDHEGSLAAWLLNVPGAHPFWKWWALAAVHLRPIHGVRPARKHFPEAEYEFLILAIDPTGGDPDPAKPPSERGMRYLTPVDLVHQIPGGVSDSDVARIAGLMVKAIVDGKMSPDQDYREVWRGLIDGTVAHFRDGKHPTS